MELTEELKKKIDAMTYEQLLSRWRFTPVGEPIFQGESGEYWGQRMKELRGQPGGSDEHVRASKNIGWGG